MIFSKQDIFIYLKVVCCLLVLAGCSTPQAVVNFNNALEVGNLTEAKEIAKSETKATMSVSQLRWTLEAAALQRMHENFEESNKSLDITEKFVKEEEEKNLLAKAGSSVGSILVNDNVQNYSPKQYDRVMLNTYKALNFWHLNDYDNARVEWNRVDERQRRAAEYFTKEIERQRESLQKEGDNTLSSYQQSIAVIKDSGVDINQWQPYKGYINPASLYMHGLFFALNKRTPADVGKARDSYKRLLAFTNNPQVKLDYEELRKKGVLSNGVWVIFENGTVARKYEQKFQLPLFIVTRKANYTGIALPLLQSGKPAFSHISIAGKNTQPLSSMDKIVEGEFKTEFTSILTKEIIRALVKTGTQVALLKSDNSAANIAGHLFSVYQYASTQADLRSWHTLPYEFQLTKVAYPKNNKLLINFPLYGELTVDLPENNKKAIVYIRAISDKSPPIIGVLTNSSK